MASWNTYLDSLVTDILAIAGTPVSHCERAAIFDAERMIRVPRWPKVIVTDLGGSLDFSGRIWEREVGITIAVFVPAGVQGAKASQQLSALQETLTTELEHTRRGSDFSFFMDTEEVTEIAGAGEIYAKTLVASYQLER